MEEQVRKILTIPPKVDEYYLKVILQNDDPIFEAVLERVRQTIEDSRCYRFFNVKKDKQLHKLYDWSRFNLYVEDGEKLLRAKVSGHLEQKRFNSKNTTTKLKEFETGKIENVRFNYDSHPMTKRSFRKKKLIKDHVVKLALHLIKEGDFKNDFYETFELKGDKIIKIRKYGHPSFPFNFF